jgi:hypothetical protein
MTSLSRLLLVYSQHFAIYVVRRGRLHYGRTAFASIKTTTKRNACKFSSRVEFMQKHQIRLFILDLEIRTARNPTVYFRSETVASLHIIFHLSERVVRKSMGIPGIGVCSESLGAVGQSQVEVGYCFGKGVQLVPEHFRENASQMQQYWSKQHLYPEKTALLQLVQARRALGVSDQRDMILTHSGFAANGDVFVVDYS